MIKIKYDFDYINLFDDIEKQHTLNYLGIAIYTNEGVKRNKYNILCELADTFKELPNNKETEIMLKYVCKRLLAEDNLRYGIEFRKLLNNLACRETNYNELVEDMKQERLFWND